MNLSFDRSNPKHFFIFLATVFILVAIPITVFSIVTLRDNKTKAATAFELTTCATTLDPSGQSQCGNSVGNPNDYNFCDRWTGGFCDDFRSEQHTSHNNFPAAGDPYTFDRVAATVPSYDPCCFSGNPFAGQYVFTANEHFMTAMIDDNFGMTILRLKQPFDFAGRTGHIHYDVDLKNSERRYTRLTLSPFLTKRGPDDRNATDGPTFYPKQALDIWFKGKGVAVTSVQNNTCGIGYCYGNTFFSGGLYQGYDNVRDHIDVYVSRTHLKITVNGNTVADTTMVDTGFDRSYVYFQQVSYNPCKDGITGASGEVWPNSDLDQCSSNAQQYHWDNLAFDGPKLAENSLTPEGSEDVVFNAYSVGRGTVPNTINGHTGDCTVNGIAATPAAVGSSFNTWVTWVARLPANTPVTIADIKCVYNDVQNGSDTPRALEIVQAGATTTPPPPPPPSLDVTPPEVSITSPANSTTVSGLAVNVAATASDNVGVTKVEFYIDTVLKTIDSSTPYSYSWDSTALSNGSHAIKAIAYDAANNTTSASLMVTSSNSVSIAPVLYISAPTSGESVSGTVTIQAANTAAGSAVSNINFLVDGAVIGSDTTSPYSLAWDSTKVINGSHQITVRPVNVSGPDVFVNVTVNNTIAASGYTAEYFSNQNLTTPVAFTQNEAVINHDWGYGALDSRIPSDNVSVRWTGTFNFDAATYRFNATADDGVRIFVDGTAVNFTSTGKNVLNSWVDHPATTFNGLKSMTSGSHKIVVEYYENSGQASIKGNFVHASTCFDMDGDGKVTDTDLTIAADHFGIKGASSPWDVNGDRSVTSADLGKIAQQKGTSCS